MMRRLSQDHRKTTTSKTRSDLVQKDKERVYKTLTKEERKREEERREEKRKSLTARLAEIGAKVWKEADKMAVDFGFDSQHWYYYILQNARLARSSRKPNRWNAFVAIMLESINARKCC